MKFYKVSSERYLDNGRIGLEGNNFGNRITLHFDNGEYASFEADCLKEVKTTKALEKAFSKRDFSLKNSQDVLIDSCKAVNLNSARRQFARRWSLNGTEKIEEMPDCW